SKGPRVRIPHSPPRYQNLQKAWNRKISGFFVLSNSVSQRRTNPCANTRIDLFFTPQILS
ncbi:hypothetical protein, partial [Pedobacter sp. B4-66]|uniref:hypothetical protein n=1 Tax=Pedobacter sp. B4-66 TaxID=2817280 RepID=UPI001BD9BC48